MDNQNKKPLSLYAMWLEAHNRNVLPAEWKLAHNFLTWATKNGYKTEYGYEGEFAPDNLRAAILGAKDADVRATVAYAFGLPAELLGKATANIEDYAKNVVGDSGQVIDPVSELVKNNTLATLKEMAKGIDIGKATRKEDIAKLIVSAREVK